MEIIQALSQIIKNITSTADNLGFSVVVPDSIGRDEAPISVSNGKYSVVYTSGRGSFKIEVSDSKIYLKCSSAAAADSVEEDYTQQSASLFESDMLDNKDISYISNEFCDTIEKVYSKSQKNKSVKLPTPVSKTAAKNGSVYFDTVTLASRLVQIYPQCKDAYRENIEKYGEFLPEDFFVNHCNKYVLDTIRANEPHAMKKLFNCLNEIYNDGTNEVQSVIVVTILGNMMNDEKMLANCVDYMEDMTLSVIETNKYLKKSKRAQNRLANPPKYKPKKEKKKNPFFSQTGI